MTFSNLDLWGGGWLAAKPPTNPLPTLKMKNACHSERSEESKMFLPDTSDREYIIRIVPVSKFLVTEPQTQPLKKDLKITYMNLEAKYVNSKES
jgi:hypothetical protein